MKNNTLFFILLMGSLNFSIAQESSPTKEVTVQSINKYMNEAVGMKKYSVDDSEEIRKRADEITIESNSFSLDQISLKLFINNYEYGTGKYLGTCYENSTRSNLNWDNCTITIDSSETLFRESNLAEIIIYPKSKIKWEYEKIPGTYNIIR
jgi:hypothetical protein